jgi:D-alanyl-D-alanine dipeptidase
MGGPFSSENVADLPEALSRRDSRVLPSEGVECLAVVLAVPDLDILADAMNAAGLVNYPAEWWHWSYGDRYWAFQASHGTALYGPC